MFSDALDREADWLRTDGDGLPTLLGKQGGPFAIIQARLPRTASRQKPCLYVVRWGASEQVRSTMMRTMMRHRLRLVVDWPVANGTGSLEAEWLKAEQAVDSVVERLGGFMGDHTHGGRFLSAAEGDEGISINPDDPERPSRALGFRIRIDYIADDLEVNG